MFVDFLRQNFLNMKKNDSENCLEMFDLMSFERSSDGKIVHIGERQKVVDIIELDFKEKIKKALNFEFCSGLFMVYDITDSIKDKNCKIPGCNNEAQVLEARLVAVATNEGEGYLLSEIDHTSKIILADTRRRVKICYNHQLENLLNGNPAEDYEEVAARTNNVVKGKFGGLKQEVENPFISDLILFSQNPKIARRKASNDNGK